MERKIGSYKLFKRTEYSKFQVLDENNVNVSNTPVGKKIIEDYLKQIEDPDKYFMREDDFLLYYIKNDDIENVFIPEGETSLPRYFFEGSSIIRVSLPDTIKDVGKSLFEDCHKLKEVDLSMLEDLDFGDIFNGCESLETVYLSDTVKNIPNSTFYRCESLSTISLPENLNAIESHAFCHCENLRKIYIPDNVSEIWNYAFSDCTNLKEINFPKNLKRIGSHIFADSGIETLHINYDIQDFSYATYKYVIDGYVLADSNIRNLVIDRNAKFIDKRLFNVIGPQISSLIYIGTKEEFKQFKKNNKELLNLLSSAKLNVLNNNIDTIVDDNKSSVKNLFKNIFQER